LEEQDVPAHASPDLTSRRSSPWDDKRKKKNQKANWRQTKERQKAQMSLRHKEGPEGFKPRSMTLRRGCYALYPDLRGGSYHLRWTCRKPEKVTNISNIGLYLEFPKHLGIEHIH
jgi:hypothetical protein